MSLSPRAIALQGIGFAPRVLALQGFAQAQAPLAAGGYDDDKPKRKRYVVERHGKLLVYASQAAALRALQAEEAQQAPQEAAEEVALPVVQAYAEVAGRLDDYNAAYNSQHFEQLLALFDQMRAQLDEEDIEMLLLVA